MSYGQQTIEEYINHVMCISIQNLHMFSPLLSCTHHLRLICQVLGNEYQWGKKIKNKIITMFVSPIDCWVEHISQISVIKVRLSISFNIQSWKFTILCNLKSHVVTYPMFVCPRDINCLPRLQYKFWISLCVSSIRESIYLDLCNHKKNNSWML